MPVCFPEKAGEPYRPSNGTEGEKFEAMFCERCVHDQAEPTGCEIVARALAFEINEPDYPRDKWVYDEDGRPKCTEFSKADEGG